MNILIAADKFKDAASAVDVCSALRIGIGQTFSTANIKTLPLADGGEGTLDVLKSTIGGEFVTCTVLGPLFMPVQASYLYNDSAKLAVIEMARASGLELLKLKERNCMHTTSFGTGQLIANALDLGARKVVVTVGGTATNDAGIGMALALGYELLDKQGNMVQPVGNQLINVATINTQNVHRSMTETEFVVATDVTNPFYGTNGAACVYARQKGATYQEVAQLDDGLRSVARVFEKTFGKVVQNTSGTGAGGGIGGGAICFLNARITSGANWILETLNVQQQIEWADLLITGEGRFDGQSLQGKLFSQLIAFNKPTILVCGALQEVGNIENSPNVIYATAIADGAMPLRTALSRTEELLRNKGLMLGKFLKFFQEKYI